MSAISLNIEPITARPDAQGNQAPDFDDEATLYATQLHRLCDQANELFSAVNALMSGIVHQDISVDLNLSFDSPRKTIVNATSAGLSVRLPEADTLPVNGDLWVIANAGANAINIPNLGGDILPGGARGFVLASYGSSITSWLTFELDAWVTP